jgi:PPOX class probable F420-dependent enzyme
MPTAGKKPAAAGVSSSDYPGGQMPQLTDKQREFIAQNPFVATVTTLRPDGSPHSTIVWVDAEDGVVTFNTAVGRAKERYLRQDPRAAITVVHPENAYQWVSVSGPAELTTEGADAQIDHLAKKYLGKDEYPWRSPTEQRITVRIRPEKVDASGFDD